MLSEQTESPSLIIDFADNEHYDFSDNAISSFSCGYLTSYQGGWVITNDSKTMAVALPMFSRSLNRNETLELLQFHFATENTAFKRGFHLKEMHLE